MFNHKHRDAATGHEEDPGHLAMLLIHVTYCRPHVHGEAVQKEMKLVAIRERTLQNVYILQVKNDENPKSSR